MLRITHITYDEQENKYYIRFAGEPFYWMVEKMKSFGRDRARFDPDYTWPDGREKAWYVNADVLETLTIDFYGLKEQMKQAREKYHQESLFEDDAEYVRKEAAKRAQEQAKQQEAARKQREEAERLRREAEERFKQEYARREQERSPYTPARVQDALMVLGLSMPVTKDEVKSAYRKLMLLHHPDKHMLASPDVRKQHEQECKKINSANDEVLRWIVIHESSHSHV
jgi:hypothetical protein